MPKPPDGDENVERVLDEMPTAALLELQDILEGLKEITETGAPAERQDYIIRYQDKKGVARHFSIAVMSGKDFKKGFKK